MNEDAENSSLPVLLAISGAVLLVAVGGWFLLEQEPPIPATPEPVADTATVTAPAPDVAAETSSDTPTDEEPSMPEPMIKVSDFDLDAELLKAQLAAEADILILPEEKSALYYYGKILEVDPRHAIANAELESVLARVGRTVSRHLAARDYARAYNIAVLVARYRPEHQLVVDTQRTLDARTEELVQDAIQQTQEGNDEEAANSLAEGEALPGRNPDYFVGVRSSIQEIQDVRQAADDDKVERSLLATESAKDAWVASTRDAIARGNLISPSGASAKDLLAETNAWTEEREALTEELFQALVDTARMHIESTEPVSAEALLDAAAEYGAEEELLDSVRVDLESTYLDIESSRVVSLEELVRLKTVAPSYPLRAQERGVTGSVDLEFTVTTDGLTSDVVVVAAEPDSVFENSAIAAVQKWEFQPREFRGQIIDQRVNARLVFRLDE